MLHSKDDEGVAYANSESGLSGDLTEVGTELEIRVMKKALATKRGRGPNKLC